MRPAHHPLAGPPATTRSAAASAAASPESLILRFADSIRWTGADALLHDMRKLVDDQPPPGGCARRVCIASKHQLVPDREGQRSDRLGCVLRVRVGMDRMFSEIGPEAPFAVLSDCGWQRGARRADHLADTRRHELPRSGNWEGRPPRTAGVRGDTWLVRLLFLAVHCWWHGFAFTSYGLLI